MFGQLTSCQSILEDLLKAQELEDRQVHRGMETKTSLVGSQSRVELDTVTTVDLDFTLVVLPYDTELDDPFGNGGYLEGRLVFWVLFEEGGVFKGGDELCSSYSQQLTVRRVSRSKGQPDLCTPARTQARKEDSTCWIETVLGAVVVLEE